MTVRIIIGDCRTELASLPDASVHCCVTSPPYFRLRDYDHPDQMGMEDTPDAFVDAMVAVFREVRRVLREDGTLWLNIGDSYATNPRGNRDGDISTSTLTNPSRQDKLWGKHKYRAQAREPRARAAGGIKTKDLIGIPWMLAFALRMDGWYLRQDIIWAKPNPMPESVGDRCTKAHEYLFLLSKSPRYCYDAEAIEEELAPASIKRLAQDVDHQVGSNRVPGKSNGTMKAVGGHRRRGVPPRHEQYGASSDQSGLDQVPRGGPRNKRSVWTVATQPYHGAHFATFPPKLIEPCILAGCPVGGTVLDPFGGVGTTGLVADRLQRDAVMIELNPEHAEAARLRIAKDRGPLLATEEAS